MSKLILMCGCPGSGKSTWIQNHKNFFKDNIKVVSRDAIRFSMLKDGEDYFAHEDDVFKTFIAEIGSGLKENKTVIADATHLNPASRSKVLKALGENLKGVYVEAIFIKVSLKTALDQNENRKDTKTYVPRGVIRRMYESLETPDILEGFDKVYIYNPQSKEGSKYTILSRE